jgi:hypothetical protein
MEKAHGDQGRHRKGRLLALTGALALVALTLYRCGEVGPQSMVCRHRDDPKGQIDFRIDVGRADDRVRFADGQILPVEVSRDQITFLEKESNSFHINDNDSDEAGLGVPSPSDRALGIPGNVAPMVIHFDHRHDVEHRTTIDRRALTFDEHALSESGGLGAKLIDGTCHAVPAP